jgi:hypothetical protein
MGEWRNKRPDAGFRTLSADSILAYLDKFCNPQFDSVELTGGEPTLFDEFTQLINGLSERDIKTIIKSNGSNYVPKLPYITRVYAWHSQFPKNECDYVLIIEHEDWQEKVEYCKANNITYKTITSNKTGLPEPIEMGAVCFIDLYGGVQNCFGNTNDTRIVVNGKYMDADARLKAARRIFNFDPPNMVLPGCSHCKSYHDHVIFVLR